MLALVAASCGGGSSSESTSQAPSNEPVSNSLSKEEFVKHADAAFCASWKELTNAAASNDGAEIVAASNDGSRRSRH